MIDHRLSRQNVKFSTSIRNSTEECTGGIEDLRPSGEAVSGTSTLPTLRATVADLRVVKSKH
jgi:hypothetical protein